ncbi:FKBP-type peptidyl-prolyl cis-trans isomerase [Hyphobacterium sp.]|uniref:FKBP-type peptidyl-prolyl cis-trans isomerase n=1 Tax=Hyphobacterium sp. TaxID=2004662 RepID=UPI003BA9181C
MRSVALLGVFALAACSSNPATPPVPPVPADPENAQSVVEAARQCEVADYPEVAVTMSVPEFGGNPDIATRNGLAGELYLEMISAAPCVYALPSGLHFRILRAAGEEGLTPEGGELVRVHYEGTSTEGETFDSSYDRGTPAEFPSGRLISGWVEALGLMRTGEEWELYIPAELGYGARGTPGGPIGSNQTLYFRMELICLPGREDGGCDDA